MMFRRCSHAVRRRLVASAIVSVWARNPSSVPDAPHAAIRLITSECAEGSGVGFKKEPPVLLPEAGILNSINSDLKVHGKASIRFLFYVADSVVNQWEATLHPDCIVLCAPPKIAINGTKSSFVAMIEFIQEKLKTPNIYLEVEKDQPNLATLSAMVCCFALDLSRLLWTDNQSYAATVN
uniref:Ornithine decarboxylase antizyme n=1 Tax=Trichuris muris TaxID=70415 RepID=A0A5S6Q9R7_TRIMR